MHELMFQAGVKGMSERSDLIPCELANTNKMERMTLSCLHDEHSDFIIIATHVAPKMSDSDIFAIWPFIWAGSAGGGLLLLLILVASFFIVVYLVQQKKRRAIKSRCNISTEVAYSTTEISDSRVNPDCYSNDYENVPAHTILNADNKGSEPVLDVVYALPFEEHQFPASGMVLDKDCIATHTNAAYASSKSPLAAELEPVYDNVLPGVQQTSASEKR